jgi:uncharacterized repeat protein (TIGR01451 family)
MHSRRAVLVSMFAILLFLRFATPAYCQIGFSSPVNYPVGIGPSAVVAADFNGDGKLDLAVANSDSNNVSILLGNGDGTFQPAVNYSVGHSPKSIVMGDFNGDGKGDLAVANSVDGTVSILLGNGDGTFQSAMNFGAGLAPNAIVVGDFNGDDLLDVAVANQDQAGYAGKVSVLLGNGDGTFGAGVSYDAGGSANALVVADFNGDKKLDLAVANTLPGEYTCVPFVPFCGHPNGNVSIFLGNGDGTFQTPLLAFDASVSSLAVGDLNGDGKPDLALGFGYFTYLGDVLLGNGNGTFESRQVIPASGLAASSSVAIVDMNGDKKADFLAVSGDLLYLFLGNGDGSFQSLFPYQPALEFIVPTAGQMATADLNGDGLLDVVLTTPNGIGIMLNNKGIPGADLAVGIGQGGGPGQILTYTVVANNRGPQPATNVTVTDTIPAGSAVVQLGGNCTGTSAITCDMGDLPTGGVNTGVILIYTPAAGGSVTNSARISADEKDPDLTNNVAIATFNAPPGRAIYTVTVVKGGNGGGVVAGGSEYGTGINCGNVCSQNNISGNAIALVATSDTGSSFTGWSGACTGTDPNNCQFILSSNAIVTASFVLPPDFTLAPATSTLSSSPGGQATDPLTIVGQNGFTGTVALTCSVSGPTPTPSCSLSPSSVPAGATAITSTLSVSAQASTVLFPYNFIRFRVRPIHALGMALVLIVFLIMTTSRASRCQLAWRLSGAIALVFVCNLAACGGGSKTTPPELFSVTVTAKSGALVHTTSVSLTVQ